VLRARNPEKQAIPLQVTVAEKANEIPVAQALVTRTVIVR
jgi:hypothetical protein